MASVIVVSVISQKGGVGKTTTALNVAVALARQGHRVIALDLDPQSHLSHALPLSGTFVPIAAVLDGTVPLADALLSAEGIRMGYADLERLGQLEQDLPQLPRRAVRLRDALAAAGDLADVVLIDTPPNLGFLSLNALVAAQFVLVPLPADRWALDALGRLIGLVADVNARYGGERHLVISRTMVAATRLDRQCDAECATLGVDRLSSIRRCQALRDAAACRRTIFQYAPRSTGAHDYAALAADLERQWQPHPPVG